MDGKTKLQLVLNTLREELEPHRDKPAAARQIERLFKKARLGDPALAENAVADFLRIIEAVSRSVPCLDPDILRESRVFIRDALENVSSLYSDLNIQVSLDRTALFDLWRFGPGASVETRGTHVAEKLGQAWSVTSRAAPLVNKLRRRNFYLDRFDSAGNRRFVLVEGSKLATVPKNQEKDRTIAIEPLGNMALQLAAGQYFADALKLVGLDIRNQQLKNRALARRGSVDGSIATIDLSSASDMISLRLVESLLPSEWFDLLCQIRSERILVRDSYVDLPMISTMGNGFTFSLMTLCLVSLIYGMRRVEFGGRRHFVDWHSTAVYGDDIIVPTKEYDRVVELLTQAGLVVNHDKSFSTGEFRESCGGDYLGGIEITPVYITSLDNDAEVYVAMNRLVSWSSAHNVSVWKTLSTLKGLLKGDFLVVPEWFQIDSGFQSPGVNRRFKYLKPKAKRHFISADRWELMPLACGGYVTSAGKGGYFVPRQLKTRYSLANGRLPKGFLTGRDPSLRGPAESNEAETFVSLAAGAGLTGPR